MTAAVWGAAALAALVVLVVLVVLVRCLVGLVGGGVAGSRSRPPPAATGSGPGRVVRLEPGGSAHCIEATSPVLVADEMLATKLLLETDERRFLATAHRYQHR